jgi:hypothetical protein
MVLCPVLKLSSQQEEFDTCDRHELMFESPEYDQSVNSTVENINPSVFAAKANSEGTPSYEEAMHGPLAGEFRKSLEF